jgi:hypothetical protein
VNDSHEVSNLILTGVDVGQDELVGIGLNGARSVGQLDDRLGHAAVHSVREDEREPARDQQHPNSGEDRSRQSGC